MAESGSELQPTPSKPKLINKVFGILRSATKPFEIDTTPIPTEKINTSTVASTIDTSVYNPLQKDRFVNGFDLGTLLANMNYPVTWESDDYRDKYPEQYQVTRQTLQQLVHQGVIEMQALEKPTKHGETIWYRVIDEAKLKELAKKTSA